MTEQFPIGRRLRAFTPARVGLGRTGVSQHTIDILQFQRAHALARDAVHSALDTQSLSASIKALDGVPAVLNLHSAARDRRGYLQRPDLGRTLDESARRMLADRAHSEPDLALVIADGLSALAVERHARPLLEAALPLLEGWMIAPVCIVEQGRVAVGDEIGELLSARIAVVLIGERPGLSSPDSLGAYITWMPRRGRTDAERACISNIRPEGLAYPQAAAQLCSVLVDARRNQLTGTALSANPSTLSGGAAS